MRPTRPPFFWCSVIQFFHLYEVGVCVPDSLLQFFHLYEVGSVSDILLQFFHLYEVGCFRPA